MQDLMQAVLPEAVRKRDSLTIVFLIMSSFHLAVCPLVIMLMGVGVVRTWPY